MPALIACPNADAFAKLAAGDAGAEEMEQFAAHVEECPSCASRMDAVGDQSLLVKALRASPSQGPDDTHLQPLMAKLEKLADPNVTAVTPSPVAAEISTDTGVKADVSDTEIDFSKLLAPAQGPGELGRLGSYRVLKILGAGGMGVVFQAEDTVLKRRVALKAMRPEFAASGPLRQRFLREAQAAAAVHHDHVVVIHHAGEESGVAFLAMELLEGESLEARLRRADNGRLPLTETLRIGREIAEGLAAAHEHGLIHRDIKPNNIWLQNGRARVKILDFGLARATNEDGKLTSAGAIIGTPAFMSPEQANAEPLDFRTDLFSLGCVLYRMCTGVVPFPGNSTLQILRAVAEHQPKPPRVLNPALPAELSALVMRLLEKDRGKRPESARQVAAELTAIKPDTALAGTHRAPRRIHWLPRGIAACLLLSLLGLVGYLYGTTIIRIATNKGELIVEVDADDVEVSVKQGATTVVDRKKDRTFVLTAKGGEVEFFDPATGVRLLTKEFKLERGGVTVVRAREELAQARRVTPPEPHGKQPPAFSRNEPLGPLALVTKPATIPGVKSWTIQTVWPRDSVGEFAFSPDGARLATWGPDRGVRIWDAKTGKLIRALDGQVPYSYQHRNCATWSKDGKLLACVGRNGHVEVWDEKEGKFLWSARAGDGTCYCVCWSPDGKTLAVGGSFGDIKLFGVDAQVIDSWKTEGSITSLAWSPTGKTIASSGNNKAVVLWNTEKGAVIARVEMDNGGDWPMCLNWSPNGHALAISKDGRIKIWNAGNGKVVDVLEPDPNEKLGTNVFFDWAEGGKLKGIWGSRGYWDPATAKWTRPLQAEAMLRIDPTLKSNRPDGWSPDGKMWVTLHSGGADAGFNGLKLWGLETGKPVYSLNTSPVIVASAVAPDGKLIALASWDNTVRIVERHTGRIMHATRWPGDNRVIYVAWSPDGKKLALGNYAAGTYIYDLPTKKLVPLRTVSNAATWSHDSILIALAHHNGLNVGNYLSIFDARTREQLVRFEDQHFVKNPAFSPKKNLVAIGHKNGIHVYDIAKNEKIKTEVGDEQVTSLAWSPDGKRIAGGEWNVAIWEIESGKIIKKLAGSSGRFQGPLIWSPDGNSVSARDEYSNVCCWSVASGKLLSKKSGITWDKYLGTKVDLRYVPLVNDQFLAISPEGHYRGTPKAERELVYVVETEHGQETLTPAEMAKKYGWKNDPDKVRLIDK